LFYIAKDTNSKIRKETLPKIWLILVQR
jgi:hypothetical protein